ncbi:hypothetical protein DF186_14165, partial [Enterococcus hirae]
WRSDVFSSDLNPPQTSPESQKLTNLKTLINKILKHQKITTKNHKTSIKNLEKQIGQIFKQISVKKPSNSLPSNTIPNPKKKYKTITVTNITETEKNKKTVIPSKKNFMKHSLTNKKFSIEKLNKSETHT